MIITVYRGGTEVCPPEFPWLLSGRGRIQTHMSRKAALGAALLVSHPKPRKDKTEVGRVFL